MKEQKMPSSLFEKHHTSVNKCFFPSCYSTIASPVSTYELPTSVGIHLTINAPSSPIVLPGYHSPRESWGFRESRMGVGGAGYTRTGGCLPSTCSGCSVGLRLTEATICVAVVVSGVFVVAKSHPPFISERCPYRVSWISR